MENRTYSCSAQKAERTHLVCNLVPRVPSRRGPFGTKLIWHVRHK